MARDRKRKPGYRPRVAGGSRTSSEQTWRDVTVPDEPQDSTTAQPNVDKPAEKPEQKPEPAEKPEQKPEPEQEPEPTEKPEPEQKPEQKPEPEQKSEAAADKADETAADATAEDAADAAPGDETAAKRPTGKTRPVSRVATLRPNADRAGSSPTAAAPKKTKKKQRAERGRRRYLPGPKTTAVLLVIAVLLAVFAIVAALHPGAGLDGNKAFVDRAKTSELLSQANDKVCTANSATSDGFDKWVAAVRSDMTGRALDQFNKAVPTFKQQFAQEKTDNECHVDAVGVQNMTGTEDGAKATVVINMVVSGKVNNVSTQSITPRYAVTMVRQGDQWLIENYADIAGS